MGADVDYGSRCGPGPSPRREGSKLSDDGLADEPADGSGAGADTESGEVSLSARPPWLLILAGLLALYYAATFVDVWWASKAEYRSVDGAEESSTEETDATDNADGGREMRAAVVLGAAQYNGSPSPVLESRLNEAAALYEDGQVDLVVLTGGGQEADITTEAKTGYDYLRARGIPDEKLRLEVQGGSTYESLAATARFLRRESVSEVVLVTDRYHAKRASLIAGEVGLRPEVALTEPGAPFDRLVREAAGVSLGRVISFRRLDRL